MTIRYLSTRGQAPALSFEDAVLAGLAPDGGLYVPDCLPAFSPAELEEMKSLSYPKLAFAIMSRFAGGIESAALKAIIEESYKEFSHPDIAPLHRLDTHTHILELFHGPTLAFKDFALQFLGRLLDHILTRRGQKATVIGATSGDTGSAAIHGCRGRTNMQIFILHPKGRVSDVQRKQMTTVPDANVHNIAIEGTFDDCQAIVKNLFADMAFREKYRLTAVNSINWARILAQIVYYFYAGLKLDAPASFSVPTGNFGDIYAGYLAKRMGLPVKSLIIATNRNDILTRCVETGSYATRDVKQTLSPSMDIQVSSNFERLLYDLYDGNGKAVAELMETLKKTGSFALAPAAHAKLKSIFAATSVDDDTTLMTIAETHKKRNYLLDPHSAVGLAAGQRLSDGKAPLVVLATAHPAKFPDAVKKATGVTPALPAALRGMETRPERFDTLENNAYIVKDYINKHSL